MHWFSLQAGMRPSRAVCAAVLWVASAATAVAAPGSAVDGPLARSHLDHIAALAKLRTDKALCPALLSADRLQQALGAQFQQRRDVVYERFPDDPEALRRLGLDVAEAAARLPGVGLAVGAESIYHHVRYRALSSYLPPHSPAARTLRLAGDIWPEPIGAPIAFEAATDVSGCWRPSAVLAALRSLAGVWPAAPSCLQSHLRPKLAALQDQLGGAACYCEDRERTESALADIGRLNRVFAAPAARGASGGREP